MANIKNIPERRAAAKAQTLSSQPMDPVKLANLLLDAGFTPEEAVVMHAIGRAESDHRVTAMNVDKKHGGEDYGLYQINEIHKPDMKRVYDPKYNVALAKKIYDRQGYTAWVAYDHRFKDEKTRGYWETHVANATAAVDAALKERGEEVSVEVPAPPPPPEIATPEPVEEPEPTTPVEEPPATVQAPEEPSWLRLWKRVRSFF